MIVVEKKMNLSKALIMHCTATKRALRIIGNDRETSMLYIVE